MVLKQKEEVVKRHYCGGCHGYESNPDDVAVLEVRTSQGIIYKCGLGYTCATVDLYNMFNTHEHSTKDGFTSVPLKRK